MWIKLLIDLKLHHQDVVKNPKSFLIGTWNAEMLQKLDELGPGEQHLLAEVHLGVLGNIELV